MNTRKNESILGIVLFGIGTLIAGIAFYTAFFPPQGLSDDKGVSLLVSFIVFLIGALITFVGMILKKPEEKGVYDGNASENN